MADVRSYGKKEYRRVNPEFIDKNIGVAAFPAIFQSGSRRMGIRDFSLYDQLLAPFNPDPPRSVPANTLYNQTV